MIGQSGATTTGGPRDARNVEGVAESVQVAVLAQALDGQTRGRPLVVAAGNEAGDRLGPEAGELVS